jgi:hypothetical protein
MNEHARDPFQDPDGQSALKADTGPAMREKQERQKNVRPDELRALSAARAGARLREVEIDRLVWLGFARRGPEGELELI